MTRMTKIAVSLMLLSMTAVSAQAQMQSAGRLDRPGISRTANELFSQVCVERFGDRAGMGRALEKHGFNPAPPEAAAQAAARLPIGEPGQVWRWNDATQPMLVVIRDAGVRCQLMAPFVDVEESPERFRQTMTELRRAGVKVETERDEPADLGGQPGRQVFFRVHLPDGNGESRLFALSVAPPRTGGVSLIMTASSLPPQKTSGPIR
ncbi:hypothetical protein LNAOJCKE_4820 [Methylorubrum aminovorans]|uniref:Uncharacterized protein n=2 Tax=Methylorubrum aminovorans TaxID=269069 RepID=A0ABQ4UK56_9HYPH|nr:hypothetical protein LNAOJCKE_4820 [Methylorubrum aminovorans]